MIGGSVGARLAGAVPAAARQAASEAARRAGTAAGAVAEVAVETAVRAAAVTVAVPVAAASSFLRDGQTVTEEVRREAAPVSRELLDLHPERQRRRVWSGHGHAHVEVRGMTGSGPRHRRLAGAVRRRLGQLNGVRWAEVNAVTGQVLVAFDERRVDVGTVLEVVRAVEEAHGTREEGFPWSRPVHPSDGAPIGAAALELACDCLAVTTALVGRVTRLPALPRAVRVAPALLEVERPLRRRLKRQIGPIGTDVVLALAAAGIEGLSQGPGMPAVDALYRAELLAEALSRRLVWERREAELCCSAETVPREAPVRPPRPRPRPDGPIEEWSNRLGPAALAVAGGVLALTRSPGRAADAMLAAVPRAARLGREGFATTVGRMLAQRGVVPLNAAAWRRLDRVSAIVLDSPVLCATQPLTDSATDDAATEGGALAPLAAAVVDAARSNGSRVLLTQHPGVTALAPRVDEVLTGDRSLAEHVLDLQGEGHGVLVVSGAADDALAVADVGVAVLGGSTCVCWSADLLCGPGLEDAWRVLQAAGAARGVSARAVRLAQAGWALGVLLAVVDRRPGRPAVLAPVYGTGLLALADGTVTGLRVANRTPPR